jgi:hypothetical protein
MAQWAIARGSDKTSLGSDKTIHVPDLDEKP